MSKDVTIGISGAAGMGMQSISFTLAKSFLRAGYNVFVWQDVMSRIRGGNNTSIIRISTSPVNSIKEKFDILVALDLLAIKRNALRVQDGGILLYDGDKQRAEVLKAGWVSVPFDKLAVSAGGDKIMVNSVATGAVLALLGADIIKECEGVIKELFSKKGTEVVSGNIKAVNAGIAAVTPGVSGKFMLAPTLKVNSKNKILINGSEALGIGAVSAGLKFYSGYPMSPATSIMEYVAAKAREYGIVLEQAEDEIAAINMAIGAGYGGVRAMTCTSGGGFALMIEGVSLAGMTETPVVIGISQRPGPATGFPTRTEQGDLNMVLFAGHGDFARVILAPATAADGPLIMSRAFNLAEKYQVPVFVLSDQYFNDSSFSVNLADVRADPVSRGGLLAEFPGNYNYKRYDLSAGRVSPRLIPGAKNQVVYADSDEHTEEGHITESAELRVKMVDKRAGKLAEIVSDMDQPVYFGSEKPETVLVSWGSSFGAVKEAADLLNASGKPAGLLHFTNIWPLPEIKLKFNESAVKRFICAENNYSGQFADLLEKNTKLRFSRRILRYDGHPLTAEYIVGGLEG